MKKGVVSVIPCPWGLCPWVGLILNQTDFDHSEKFKLNWKIWKFRWRNVGRKWIGRCVGKENYVISHFRSFQCSNQIWSSMGNYIHCKLTNFYLTVPFMLAIFLAKNKQNPLSRHKTLLDLQSHMIGILMIRMTVKNIFKIFNLAFIARWRQCIIPAYSIFFWSIIKLRRSCVLGCTTGVNIRSRIPEWPWGSSF